MVSHTPAVEICINICTHAWEINTDNGSFCLFTNFIYAFLKYFSMRHRTRVLPGTHREIVSRTPFSYPKLAVDFFGGGCITHVPLILSTQTLLQKLAPSNRCYANVHLTTGVLWPIMIFVCNFSLYNKPCVERPFQSSAMHVSIWVLCSVAVFVHNSTLKHKPYL